MSNQPISITDPASPVEFIGIAATQESSESQGPRSGYGFGTATSTETESKDADGPVINVGYLDRIAQAHEESGFDRILVAHSSSSPDGFVVASQVLQRTDRLGVLLAHRPGFLAPTLAARAYATLDAFHPGRVALHTITGGDDLDQARDGDHTDKATRYARTDDFLEVVRKEWDSEQAFDHDGPFYSIKGGWSSVRPEGRIPVYFGGASDDAVRVGGKHADVFAFWGEPLDGIRERIAQVRAAAAAHGRTGTRFSVSLRPIVADTEKEAWERAEHVLEQTRARFDGSSAAFTSGSEGSQRLQRVASKGDLHDKRLWTAVAGVTGGAGNSTALVGSYEQVAEALLEYVKLGVSTLLIRGFDPLPDAVSYGSLVPLVREAALAVEPERVSA